MIGVTITRKRAGLLAVSVAALALGGLGIAAAATTSSPPSNAVSGNRGIGEFGMTTAYLSGKKVSFRYTAGYYCDVRVSSAASTNCEAGANYKKAPSKDYDPLYITVPLGFNQSRTMIDCPSALVCVDHPGTIDLSRLEPTLKPLYPKLTNAQLTAALKNAPLPGHDHFITTANGGHAEWWDVKVVGVTSAKTYKNIQNHGSYSYIQSLIKAKNKTVVGPIPTNVFLYFSVQ